jgi:hypothetical protein
MSPFRFLARPQLALAIVVFAAAASAEATVIQITANGDPITGISATTIGGNDTVATAGTGSGQFPAAESPPNAIDQSTGTKYLNFGNGASGVTSATKGVGTGFYVTPVFGSSIANAIKLATANDSPNRDPLTVSLEGSNATGANLDLGSSWTLIQSSINLGIGADPGRLTSGPLVTFANTTPYTSYRVLVQSQRGIDNSTQYSELNLFSVPEPTSLVLAGLGFASFYLVAGRRRRINLAG